MDQKETCGPDSGGELRAASSPSGKHDRELSRLGDRPTLVAVGAIAAAAILTYSNSFSGPFIFDDMHAIRQNTHVRSLSPLSKAMGAPDQSSVSGRPVVALSLAVNYAVSGYETWSYHALNFAVHLLCGLLLFGIIRRTLLSQRLRRRFGADADLLAMVCAIIWVVHPLQTEAVTYVIQRAESMMGMFYLLTLYCAIRGFTSRFAVGWYAAAVGACATGMATKEVMVTAPVIVLLYDWVFVSRGFGRLLAKRLALYGLLAATWAVLVILLLEGPRSASAGFDFGDVTPLEYAKTQCVAIVHYIRLAFWPRPLILDYPRTTVESLGEYAPQAAVLAVLGLATMAALIFRPVWGFLGAWFFLILAPTSSFVPIADPIFEHRMYLPLAAIVAGVVAGVYTLAQAVDADRREAALKFGAFLAAAAVVALGVTSHLRNKDYGSELAIWLDTAEKTPGNHFALYNLAVALAQEGEHRTAIAKCDEAIRLKDDDARAYSHRGGCYIAIGKLDEAMRDLDKAIALDPTNDAAFGNRGAVHQTKGNFDKAIDDFTKAIESNPYDARYFNNRGAAYRSKRLHEAAIADYDKAIRMAPEYSKAYRGRALTHLAKRNYELALLDLDEAIRLKPNYRDAYRAKAFVLERMGFRKDMIANWTEAARNMANWAEGNSRLAWLLATSSDAKLRDGDKALQFAGLACGLTKDGSADALDALAAAQAELGQFPDAVATMEKACRIAAAGQSSKLSEMQARLELYKSSRPYRAPLKVDTRYTQTAPTSHGKSP